MHSAPLLWITRPGTGGARMAAEAAQRGIESLSWSPFELSPQPSAIAALTASLQTQLQNRRSNPDLPDFFVFATSRNTAEIVHKATQALVFHGGEPGQCAAGALLAPGWGSLQAGLNLTSPMALEPYTPPWRWLACSAGVVDLAVSGGAASRVPYDSTRSDVDALWQCLASERPAWLEADVPWLIVRGDYGGRGLETLLAQQARARVEVHRVLTRRLLPLGDDIAAQLESARRTARTLVTMASSVDLITAVRAALQDRQPALLAYLLQQPVLALHPRIVARAQSLGWSDCRWVTPEGVWQHLLPAERGAR